MPLRLCWVDEEYMIDQVWSPELDLLLIQELQTLLLQEPSTHLMPQALSYESEILSNRLTLRIGVRISGLGVSQRLALLQSRLGSTYFEHVRITCRIAQSRRLSRHHTRGGITEYDFFLLLSISTTFYQVGLPVPLSMQFMDPATSADKISRGSHPVFILTIQDNAVFSTLGLMPPQIVSVASSIVFRSAHVLFTLTDITTNKTVHSEYVSLMGSPCTGTPLWIYTYDFIPTYWHRFTREMDPRKHQITQQILVPDDYPKNSVQLPRKTLSTGVFIVACTVIYVFGRTPARRRFATTSDPSNFVLTVNRQPEKKPIVYLNGPASMPNQDLCTEGSASSNSLCSQELDMTFFQNMG